MRKIIKTVSVAFLISLLFIIDSRKISANFGVTPIYTDSSAQYFDFTPVANQREVLNFELTNGEDTPQKVKVFFENAITTSSGKIDHTNSSGVPRDSSLRYSFQELSQYPNEVEIPPNGMVNYAIVLTAPPEAFPGIIMGGVRFEEANSDENTDNSSQGFSINNKFAYSISIVLRGEPALVKSELKLISVFADLYNGRSVIKGNLQNPTPSLIVKGETKVNIYKKSDKARKKPLYTKKSNDMEIAPNSNFNFPVLLPFGEKINAGDYLYVQTFKSPQGEWKFEKNFTIAKEMAVKLNKKSIIEKKIEKKKVNYWFYLSIALIVIVVFKLLIFAFVKYRRLKKKLSQ